jgi:hypothetical protein
MVRKSSFESGEVTEDIWVSDSIHDRMVLKKRLAKADGSGYRDVSVEILPAAADRAGIMSIGDKQNLENLKGLLLNGIESVGNIELEDGKQVRIKDREGTPHTIAGVHSETVQAPSDIPISDTTIVEVEALNQAKRESLIYCRYWRKKKM